jgi:DNA-binding NtrC family response regulator
MEGARDQLYDVGVVRFSAQHLQCLPALIQLIRQSSAEWIAVLGPELLSSQGVRDFVGEWFFDFHSLPIDVSRMRFSLGRAFGMAHLRHVAPGGVAAQDNDLLVGNSPSIKTLRKLLAKLAPTDSPVLICGQSGTGKELVARTLHRQSRRAAGAFVAINCGAISEHLIQSELFGHEKGAFTGAHQRKIGRIESAHGGTLFLDEIGDLPLEMQANLLRFIQEMNIERVGSSKPISVDVRVLAATHVDLEEAIRQGRFREDLYYRLNVLQVHTTPLRERKLDIPLFAEHFSTLYASEIGKRPRRFSEAAINAMMDHSWPGNVRELANRVRRGQVLAEGRQIEPIDIGLTSEEHAQFRTSTLSDYLFMAERQALNDVLTRYSKNMSHAARSLGVSRPTFYRLLHKHQILLSDKRVNGFTARLQDAPDLGHVLIGAQGNHQDKAKYHA